MEGFHIEGLLVKPSRGDPHGLLRSGPCGARPPIAVLVRGKWVNPWSFSLDSHERSVLANHKSGEERLPEALVMVWRGMPVLEGVIIGVSRTSRWVPQFGSKSIDRINIKACNEVAYVMVKRLGSKRIVINKAGAELKG